MRRAPKISNKIIITFKIRHIYIGMLLVKNRRNIHILNLHQ